MESLEVINKRLIDHFGLFEDGRPNWRVVWSTDEHENRLSYYTREGFELLSPIMQYQKKYPLDQNRYILENLVPIGEIADLTTKTSYEPRWTFEDKNHNPLPPDWDAIKLIVETVQYNMSGKKPPLKQAFGEGNTFEEIKMRAEKMMDKLFGNDSKITDSLAMDTAVGYGMRKRNDGMR